VLLCTTAQIGSTLCRSLSELFTKRKEDGQPGQLRLATTEVKSKIHFSNLLAE
jgi:hypothetical protein